MELNKNIRGLLALSPLPVFLAVFLVSSIIAGDFYKVPVSSAFLLASIYAVLISKGRKIEEKIAVFSSGAGNRNVLLMIWIFILAGAFAGTAKDIGAIEATVNLTLMIIPDKLIMAGLFIASCFISMAIGTSVGTIVALVPIATGIAHETGMNLPMITAVIVGGAFFGDNLSFISDTTIASTRSQGCSMSDKFKANILIAAPAAIIVTFIYILLGMKTSVTPDEGTFNFINLLPYILVIILAVSGVNVIGVLSLGLFSNAVIGLLCHDFNWIGLLSSIGNGISGMCELIIVTMLAGGLLELIRHNGGIDFIIEKLTSKIKSKRGAEFSIAALVSLSNLCTANNTIAIITTGDIARNISERYGVDKRKSSSLLDTFSCVIQGLIPYGAQLLMASGLAGISAISIISYLYYPFVLFAIATMSILLRFPKKYS